MKLRFHRFARERAFRSASDFAKFAEAQKAAFERLQSTDPASANAFGSTMAQNWAGAAATARQPEATVEIIQARLRTAPAATFDSRLVAAARREAAMGRQRGAEQLTRFLNGDNEANAGNTILIQALDARAAFIQAVDLDNQGGRQQSRSLAKMLDEHEARLDGMLESDREEIEEKRAQYDEMLLHASNKFDAVERRVGAAIAQAKAEWQEAHDSFIERLKLDTAVDLWSKRSTQHHNRYLSFRTWTIRFGVVGGLALLIWIFAGFELASWAFPNDATGRVASYTAGSLALFTLFVWGLRVQVRTMISEDHLSTDASARSALAHTYLALTKVERATPEDRAIVLASLFAPVSDGLVKDDGMPVISPTAFAAQMLTKH